MSSPEAKAKISVDNSRFKKASREVVEDFKRMAVSGQQSSKTIVQSSNSSGNAISGFKSKIPPTRDALRSLRDQANQTGNALGGMGENAKRTGRDLTGTSIALLGLGQSITGVNDSLASFDEKQTALTKSKFGLKETTTDLRRAEEDYAKALSEKSFNSVQEQIRAEEDLLLLREKFRIETEEVVKEQAALEAEYKSFAISLGQTGLFGIIALKQLFPELSKNQILTALSTKNLGTAARFMGFNFAAASVQLKGVTLSLVGLRAGLKATWLALGPIGVALIAGTSLWAAYETNIGGFQDRIKELWNFIKKFIPVLEGMEVLVGKLFPEASASVGEFDEAVGNANNTVQTFTGSLGTLETGLQGGLVGVAEATQTAAEKFNEFGGMAFSASGELINFNDRLRDQNKLLIDGNSLFKKRITLVDQFGNEIKKNDLKITSDDVTETNSKKIEKELDDFERILVANTGLAIIRELLEQATAQARAGNLHGAIVLEKEAQRIGRATSSIAGTLRLNGFMPNMGKSGALGGLGSLIGSLQKNGLTASQIGLSLAKGASSHSIGGSAGSLSTASRFSSSLTKSSLAGTGKRRSGRDRNPLGRDGLGGFTKRLIRDLRAENPELFSRTGINIGKELIGVKSQFSSRGGNGITDFARLRAEARKAISEHAKMLTSKAKGKLLRSQHLANRSPHFTQEELLAMSDEEFSAFAVSEGKLRQEFIDSGISSQQVHTLIGSEQGRIDLENMADYQRKQLASVGIV